jgi:hypothetical protein
MGRDLVQATGSTAARAQRALERGDGDENFTGGRHVSLPEHEGCFDLSSLRKRIAKEETGMDRLIALRDESDEAKMERQQRHIDRMRREMAELSTDSPRRNELADDLETAEAYGKEDMDEERETYNNAVDDQEAVIGLLNHLRFHLHQSHDVFIAFRYD